jgi:hypothetical protein
MEGEGDMVIAMGDGELGMLDVVKGVVEGSSIRGPSSSLS